MKQFQTVGGKIIDDIIPYLKDCIKQDLVTEEFHIYIGCDSLPCRKGTATYSTVLCLYKVGKGAHILYNREPHVKIQGNNPRERLRNRLWDEVYRVVDVATVLTDGDIFNEKRISDFQIHIDVNPNEKYESNIIYKQAVGYINSLGLDAYVKPDSPAATFVSDHLCRYKEVKMTGK